jgi:hypothetical protein
MRKKENFPIWGKSNFYGYSAQDYFGFLSVALLQKLNTNDIIIISIIGMSVSIIQHYYLIFF